ncbi:dnaJ subfamily C member 7 isoform X1 [Cinnamomum micranthum f. kanehirae]|uniref:DnaJ subfamily C member 7 isoform X1 n=1 Tax=Cinnamomum micranthum f. kanehirae TaxID=337451 RepID=A0A443N626_9MAGN|nr:dnaJ subfamily C member 7 isoform X1 [Cinnamomum micranthum f. kanehirae]
MIPEDRKAKTTANNDPFQRKIQDDEDRMKLWGILLFGLIGASATTLWVGHLRRTFGWLNAQMNGSQSWKRATGGSSFREEAWKKYNRRMQEEYEEEMERVERIRRMQSVFNRERNKYKRSYESWRENGPGSYEYHQHFQRDDWYWKTDTSYKDQRTNSRATPRDSGNYSLSHHYSILGLDRSRATRYSDAEIKKAFRTKAKEYHPDQNQNNTEAAEAKFKEVMTSYEAIKLERKNGTS